MAESFSFKFKPMSLNPERTECLFPIANIPVILFTLEFLAINNVKNVVIASSLENRVFSSIVNTVRETHKQWTSNFEVKIVKINNPRSLA